jgi:hypothetical protein
MSEGESLLDEERADAAEDLHERNESGRTSTAVQGAEDSEVEDSAEEAARAEAAEFLDSYLKALLNDESTPAKGALQSLRMRMEDAGVVPSTADSSEGISGKKGTSTSVHVSMMNEIGQQRSEEGEESSGATWGSAQGAPDKDVWGAPASNSTGASEAGSVERDAPPFMHLGAPQDAFMAADEQQRIRMTGRGASEAGGGFTQVREPGEEDEILMLRGRNWAQEDPEGVAASRESCSAWSRIVRNPLKRGKHVVLDLCVASRDQRSGQLERHIVAHSDRRKAWLGPAAYRLARHAKWGDLWPSIYHRNPRVRGCQ